MGLNSTPSGERLHIALFGRRNAGKSSLINAITGQSLAIVSDIKGTTTDPVQKTMELLPLGPVVIIDTPGLDDHGQLGEQRKKKTLQTLNKSDIAVLVLDASTGVTEEDKAILQQILKKQIPCVIVENKSDLLPNEVREDTDHLSTLAALTEGKIPVLSVSAKNGSNIRELKELIASVVPKEEKIPPLVQDLVLAGDLIVLVVPIDSAAPKGRLILPQQQTIRDILDSGAISIVTRDTELKSTLASLKQKPALVITDSQAFEKVSQIVPREIPLTSFSILFARRKGELHTLTEGARALKELQDGDTVLISEGCTHHRQCDDIGTVKLPHWIQEYTGKELNFCFSSGTGFPEDLSSFRLIVHCGACMLGEKAMKYRMKCAQDAGVPMTNYGIAIACMHGILERSLEPFGQKSPESDK